jgi:hypothetical protein
MKRGVALIMVLLVLSALAIVGAPFVISMALQDKASLNFAGSVVARQAAESARNHAVARLEDTVYSEEYKSEAEVLDAKRPRDYPPAVSQGPAGKPYSRLQTGRHRPQRPGMIIRKDRGEKVPEKPVQRSGKSGRFTDKDVVGRDKDEDGKPSLPEGLSLSKEGPSPREFDAPDELSAPDLGTVKLPEPEGGFLAAKEVPGSTSVQAQFDFQDPRGVMATAAVSDEQGKINLNTAPPCLIANLFGVSQLAQPLSPRDTQIFLDDGSPFRGDADGKTLDGAVVVVDPDVGAVEAITYRKKEGDVLGECFRGAFLSLILNHVYPIGAFVYDLRGWKAGYHRLWARQEGGFHPRDLTRFSSVEALREVAGWQVASLFITRFRGEGLTADFLRENNVNLRKVSDLGLDPYIFPGGGVEGEAARKKEFEAARKELRRLKFRDDLIQKLREARGSRVVIDVAARLAKADKAQVQKVEESLTKSLAADKRRAPRVPPNYLAKALDELADAYRVPGLETFLPEDLEAARESLTVSSSMPSEWSEAQSVVDDVSLAGPEFMARVARVSDFNPGTVLRLKSASDESFQEFNEVGAAGKVVPMGGIRLAWPLQSSLKGYDALVQALQRHPVNVNTASRRVLRAVFTGVRGFGEKQVVTPYEADQLAAMVQGRTPLKGHEAFLEVLKAAAKAKAIDGDDVEPLLINAVNPTSHFLKVSTTGLCYSSGDTYTIESRGIYRSPSGSEIAQARFREIVEVSPARELSVGLMTQADFADGVYLHDPMLTPGFPETHHRFLLGFPGTRSHLVMSRPLLLHRAFLAFPGGDLGNLRLFPSEIQDKQSRFTLGDIYHFRNTYEGLELAPGEPWKIPLSLDQGGQNQIPGLIAPPASGSGGIANDDLTMVPGGIEFWLRMRTYPEARNPDGHLILFDAGSEPDRNRISLLYADRLGKVLLRIYDSSLPDPSVMKSPENGQYLEVSAQRPLELETWYHFRATWDGVFGGGAQLSIDGIPAGTDNLSTELLANIPESGPVAAITVRDASKFPREGVVRVDQELFEYSSRSQGSLQIRKQPASRFQPLQRTGQRSRGREIRPPDPKNPPGPRNDFLPQVGPKGPGGGGAGSGSQPGSDNMRAPWNKRGSTPSLHQSGTRVSLHGYSLEIRRKIHNLQSGSEYQVPDGDGTQIVWGRGGRRCGAPLYAFNFPQGIEEIVHIEPPQILGDYIVPLFSDGRAPSFGFSYHAQLLTFPRQALEYFQPRGVCVLEGHPYLYKIEDLPGTYMASQAQLGIAPPQARGLRILGSYPPGQGADPMADWRKEQQGWHRNVFPLRGIVIHDLTQRSLMADGQITGFYPPTGILELRGSPTPWEAYRPNYYGQPAFGKNPDDVVEWLRYFQIFDQAVQGEQFHLFVGRLGATYNFRGYPEHDPSDPTNTNPRQDLRKQLDHMIGEPARLVMELSEGGAGYGDYVTIATSNPNVFEPGIRRVFKVLENKDGRFFVSLLEVGSSGMDIPSSPAQYQNNYTRAMNPRLVKFPSWGLPQSGLGTGIFFQDTTAGGAASSSRSNLAGVRGDEEQDPTGITIDEVRRVRNPSIIYSSTHGPRVHFVVVPLDGGAVRFRQGGSDGTTTISGVIPADRAVSRASPAEVFVVSVSREHPQPPSIFAEGEEEGLLQIGDELFYFEDPNAGQSRAGIGSLRGTARVSNQNVPPGDQRERGPLERNTINPQNDVKVAGSSGHFEREGFARIDVGITDRERQGFYEIFYYRQAGFSQCLRGQFSTPIVGQFLGTLVHNVTRRLRLVGRSLLGTERKAHGLGDPVVFVPYSTIYPVTGPMTDAGIPVKKSQQFSPGGGYLLLDSGQPGQPWEIVAHLGQHGDGLLARPRDEKGKGILRACFGTQNQPISDQLFAYEMPYRYPDRYEAEADSESLAYLQKSFRFPGAYWRKITWLERPPRTLRERRADIVVAARFDGVPEWSAKPTNAPGGLYLFEDKNRKDNRGPKEFPLDRMGDQLEIRVYFRYPSGSFLRLPNNIFTDDWKESPILEWLTIEYEKAGAIVRHEELPF